MALGCLRYSGRFARRGAGFTATRLAAAGAAVLREIAHERIHGLEVGAVEELPALAALQDQAGSMQGLYVERER